MHHLWTTASEYSQSRILLVTGVLPIRFCWTVNMRWFSRTFWQQSESQKHRCCLLSSQKQTFPYTSSLPVIITHNHFWKYILILFYGSPMVIYPIHPFCYPNLSYSILLGDHRMFRRQERLSPECLHLSVLASPRSSVSWIYFWGSTFWYGKDSPGINYHRCGEVPSSIVAKKRHAKMGGSYTSILV